MGKFQHNETIDLAEDEDEDIMVVDDSQEDVRILHCDTKKTGVRGKKSLDDVEIVGVRIVAPLNSTSKRPMGFSTSPEGKKGIIRRKRSLSSISFNTCKQAVQRAKKRVSNGRSSIKANFNRITASSRNIQKKRKREKKRDIVQFAPATATNNNSKNPNSKRSNRAKRRSTVPVFVLDNELGPANVNWRKENFSRTIINTGCTTTSFIPISSNYEPSHPFDHQNGKLPFSKKGTNIWNNLAQNSSSKTSVLPEFNMGVGDDNISGDRAPGTPRPIIIDGSNVAMAHGQNKTFSCRGIKICADYFKRLGHSEVVAFIPRFRAKHSESVDTHFLDELEKEGVVKWTPSREVGGMRISSYDDRYIVQYADLMQGIIISNDNFKDIYQEELAWRDTIRLRILQFTWVNEVIMFPRDPLGRNGPPLEMFLRF